MKRECGCRIDPWVFGHMECSLGPPWIVRRVLTDSSGIRLVALCDRRY